MGTVIEVVHPNGYSGKLYGESSMSIFKDGKEILHTGFRSESICDEKSLYNHLGNMPKFMNLLFGNFEDILYDEDDDDI